MHLFREFREFREQNTETLSFGVPYRFVGNRKCFTREIVRARGKRIFWLTELTE
jgi:hypothetical protein